MKEKVMITTVILYSPVCKTMAVPKGSKATEKLFKEWLGEKAYDYAVQQGWLVEERT